MGRYYDGDISGKFMFSVQSSDAADRFGSAGYSNYLDYYFDEEHLPTIKKELALLKKDWEVVTKFFKGRDTWSRQEQEEAGITNQQMSNYADYCLGKEILDHVEENGECHFSAEL